ncbi:MAG: U32 family peptidase [Bacilli bacterium]|nr:U32 family peptidase [Bacilli bacterium]
MNKKVKHELLVPAGNYASVVAAINNGADAIYIGGKKFGARAFASNFSEEEIENVIKLCHLYGVKVYITVNTLVYDNEIEEAINYIRNIHSYGVDAVIMQDVGLINLVHQMFPNLEIHASTQMHNHSKESLKFLENLGIKRVVFAREMPYEYMSEIETNLEKEVFIHGSLCVSYSGQCLFSSCILNRSGNRGECAGMCRLPYKIYENGNLISTKGNYLLSPKDLCSIDHFKELLDSDIVSFKIEGRMKSPAYVGTVTRIYKNLMNQYENGEELCVNEKDLDLLKSIFNREYTRGFLFNDKDIMNFMAPNHMGVHLGDVIGVTTKKIKIKLDRDLKQFEGIRFKESNKGITINFLYDEKDNLINGAKKGDIVYLDNFINLKNTLEEVLLTTPLVKDDENITKKIPIDVQCEARLNDVLTITITDGENTIILKGNSIQESKTSPVTQERIESCLRKTGNTPFEIKELQIKCDENIFISIGSLNALRREALDKLKGIRENTKVDVIENSFSSVAAEYENTGEVINVLVRSEEQIKACKDLGIKNIIVENPKLMEPYFIYKVPRDKIEHKYSFAELLVTDYASMSIYPNNIGDYHLNITNHYTFDYIKPHLRTAMLSVEMSFDQIQEFMKYYPYGNASEILVYGRVELMLMKYCPLNRIVNKDKVCQVCQKGNKYELEDRNKALYPLINNPVTHSTTILNCEITNKINDINKYLDLGIHNFRVEFTDEDYDKSMEVLTSVINEIKRK